MIKLKKLLQEIGVEWKIVVRKGKKMRKAVCPPGYKFNPKKKKCIYIPGSEQKKQSRKAKMAAKKRAHKMNKTLKKRAKSMKKRDRLIAKSTGEVK